VLPRSWARHCVYRMWRALVTMRAKWGDGVGPKGRKSREPGRRRGRPTKNVETRRKLEKQAEQEFQVEESQIPKLRGLKASNYASFVRQTF